MHIISKLIKIQFNYQNLAADCKKIPTPREKLPHSWPDLFPGSWTRPSPKLSKIRPRAPNLFRVVRSGLGILHGPGTLLVLNLNVFIIPAIYVKQTFLFLVKLVCTIIPVCAHSYTFFQSISSCLCLNRLAWLCCGRDCWFPTRWAG